MKFVVFALFCLLAVAFGVQLCSLPDEPTCTTNLIAEPRLDNESATDLFTPELCLADDPFSEPTTDLALDHIILDFRFHRYLELQNMSGGVVGEKLLYSGPGCHSELDKIDVKTTSDSHYFYFRARIALAALQWAHCSFNSVQVNRIDCVFWMNMIEHFKLGGVNFQQTQRVRWPIHIDLPNRLQANVSLKVYPIASFQAAILVFHEYPWPAYSVRVVFVVMVSKPYMATGAYLWPEPGITGWAVPALPEGLPEQNLNDLDQYGHTSECVDYGTEYCYRQIYVDLVPEAQDPCPNKDSVFTYDGTYTLGGTTACMPHADLDPKYQCTLTKTKMNWMDWHFDFVFDTNDLCPTYLEYTVQDKIKGDVATYSDCTFAEGKQVFTADNLMCAKVTVGLVDQSKPFPFVVKAIEIKSIQVGVSYTDSGFNYYSLYPTMDPLFTYPAKIQFSGITQVNVTWDAPIPPAGTPTTHTDAYEYFSLVLTSEEPLFLLNLPPPTLRHFILNVSLDVWYDWDYTAALSKAQLATAYTASNVMGMHEGLVIPVGINSVVPPAVNPVVAASDSTALIAGVTVACVALVAAVAVGAVIVRKRRAHYAEQKDTA